MAEASDQAAAPREAAADAASTLQEFIGQGDRHEQRAQSEGYQEWSDQEWEEWNAWRWGSTTLQGTSAAQQQSLGDYANLPAIDPWRDADPWSSARPAWNHSGSWWKGRWDQKGDYSDPPAWAGWEYYRLWKKSVVRWDSNTDILPHRRCDKKLRSMGWDLQARFDHVPDHDLRGPHYSGEALPGAGHHGGGERIFRDETKC